MPEKDGEDPNDNNSFSTFYATLSSLCLSDTKPKLHAPSDQSVESEESEDSMQDCINIRSQLKQMRNHSDPTFCVKRPFMGPLFWGALRCRGNMDPDENGVMLSVAKHVQKTMPPYMLPRTHLKNMMSMFQQMFPSLPKNRKVAIKNWLKKSKNRCLLNGREPKPTPTLQPVAPWTDQTQEPGTELRDQTQEPGTQQTVQTRKPGKQQTVQTQKPGRPQTDQTQKPGRPQTDQTQEPGRPQTDQTQEPGRPQTNQTQEPGRPQLQLPGTTLQVQPRAHAANCPHNVTWLTLKRMKMMGPFVSCLDKDEIKMIPEDQLCSFLHSPEFNNAFREECGRGPFMCKKFLQKLKQCDKENFEQHVERLGKLVCCYDNAPGTDRNVSVRLLSQLDNCSNSGAIRLRKRLAKVVMTSVGPSVTPEQLFNDLGSGVTEMSPTLLSKIPGATLAKVLRKKLKAKWSRAQANVMVKKLLQNKKPQELSCDDLKALKPVTAVVPASVFQKIKAPALLKDCLNDLGEEMSPGQRLALLEKLGVGATASEVLERTPNSLSKILPLHILEQASERMTSLDELRDRQWSPPQALLLVEKIIGRGRITREDIKKLRSAIQGVVCESIDRLDHDAVIAMVEITSPHDLSRTQVRCLAKRLYEILEEERTNFFEDCSEEELDEIPTLLFIHLPPRVIRDLSDDLCSTFLDKMSDADLSVLSRRAPQRLALIKRAMDCLLRVREKNVSELSSEEVLSLGPLLCELPPAQLSQMTPEVFSASLADMAQCSQIPPHHAVPLIKLIQKRYGNPSDWPSDTMESLGLLLFWDAPTIRALRHRIWLKDVFLDLMDTLPRPRFPLPNSDFQIGPDRSVIREKIFTRPTDSPASTLSTKARRKREVTVQELIEKTIRQGEGLEYLHRDELEQMTPEIFKDNLESLGAVKNYNSVQRNVLIGKAKECWGERLERLDEEQLVLLGCVSQGYTELDQLPINSTDTLEALGHCNWTQEQRKQLWRGFVKRTGTAVGELKAADIAQLNQFICALSSEELGQLNRTVFRDAMGHIGNVLCPLVVAEQLKEIVVSLYGPPNTWTKAVVSTAGNIIVGLNDAELCFLEPSVIPHLALTSIIHIPASHFQCLSTRQLEAMSPENAGWVMEVLGSTMTSVQSRALEKAQFGTSLEDERDSHTSTNAQTQASISGAPTMTVEGIAAFLKPALFLLLSLFLL